MITAIIFDFGKVICNFDVNTFLGRIAVHTRTTLHDVQVLMPQLSRSAIRYETGLMTSDQFFAEVSNCCGLSISRNEFIHAYCEIFTPIRTTFELIGHLRPKYKLGLLSNTSEWHFNYGIKPVPVFPLFDTVTLSFEVKAMKPAIEIYLDALKKLNSPAHECVYIDDIKENADAASALGMHAVHYTTHPALLRDLAALGIDVD
jgi:putative hydrolase of the HAD superfamily